MSWSTPVMKSQTITITGAQLKAKADNLNTTSQNLVSYISDFFDEDDTVVGCSAEVTSTFGTIQGALYIGTPLHSAFSGIGSLSFTDGTKSSNDPCTKITATNRDLTVAWDLDTNAVNILDTGSIDITFLAFSSNP